MTRDSPLLQLKDLHVGFSRSTEFCEVLHGIDLHLDKGEALALVGESGSGKSVTAQAVLQLLGVNGKISQGEVWFDGEPLHLKNQYQMQKVRGKKIGMVFQDPMTSLNPTLSIGWQIAETVVFHEKLSYRAARHRAVELLDLVGIADPHMRYKAYPFQLSGGMRQRVMIAMALACSPLLLIADEPTTALDVTVQAQILELFFKIKESIAMSILLITHDLGIVAGTCDRVAVMYQGKIVETKDVYTLFSSPQHPYTRALLGGERTH